MEDLVQVLSKLPVPQHPNLLVGTDTGDDAAVNKISEDTALIQTVDLFPPVVDDPYDFGAIAVANALSDVYAMGGHPLIALNIVGFPIDLDLEILGQILRGGAPAVGSAGMARNCKLRIGRGGAYNSYRGYARAAARVPGPPNKFDRRLGFRIAKSLQTKAK